jgi:hypothetical protein
MRQTLTATLLAALAVGCGDDSTFGDRPAPEGGVIIPIVPGGDAEASEAGELCPESEPKLGDRCPPGLSEGIMCRYEVDKCIGPNGAEYGDFLDYCCLQTLWTTCGGKSVCDTFDAAVPDAPVADTRPPADAGAPDAPISDAPGQDAGQIDSDQDAGAPD